MTKTFSLMLLVSLFVLFLSGCWQGVQLYQTQENLPKPVEQIGPIIEKPALKPFELIMPKEKLEIPKRQTIEITRTDLFALNDWDAMKVSVFNLSLGDSLDLVLSTLGKPDDVVKHPTENILNIGYGKAIGLNTTAVIFYFNNNTLKRITFKSEFNQYLFGKTIINYSKKEIYTFFGMPDEQKDTAKFRIFMYKKKGLEILHSGNRMKGFVLTTPEKSILPKK